MIFAQPLEPLTPRQRNLAIAAGVAIALTRLLAVSRSMWDWDEALFTMGMRDYDVVSHHPHPPGYPLFILAAKIVHLAVRNDFRALQVVVVIAAMALFPALFLLGRELRFPFAAALGGAALCAFFPNVWYYGGTALSDVPSIVVVIFAAALLLRGCRDRNAYLLGAVLLGVAAGVRPQNMLIGLVPAAVATWSCLRGQVTGHRGQVVSSAGQPSVPRPLSPVPVLVAILAGAAVVAASYAGAALASSSWRGYLEACRAQSRYIRAVDSYVNPARPSLRELAAPIFLHATHAGRFDFLLAALAALGLLVGLRHAGARVAIAMFLPLQLFTWLMLDMSNFPRYAVGYVPLYALLIAFVLPRKYAILPLVIVACIARLIVWTLPALNEVRGHDSPVAAAMAALPRDETIYAHGGVAPFAGALLADRRVTIIENETELPMTPAPYIREGATMAPSARLFRRSRHSHLATFVRTHYFEVTIMRAEDAAVFRDGWYGEETDGEMAWRWMPGRASMLLPPAGPHARLTLHFRVPAQLQPALTLQLNGAVVDRFRCTAEEITKSWDVDARPDAANELVLSVAPVLNPLRQHRGGDPRDLGLQLLSYEWRTR